MRIYKTIVAFTLSLFLLNSCSEILSDDVEGLDERFFDLDLKIENQEKRYHIGDTIWITQEAPSQLVDNKSNKLETINNATFIFQGALSLLYSEEDSINFITKNFALSIEHGELELVNVYNYEGNSYQLIINYGLPSAHNKLKFGLIPEFPGTYVINASGSIYYGDNRVDANDFSIVNNRIGNTTYLFENSDINFNLFEELPNDVRQGFLGIFSTQAVASKMFYFIKVE